MLHLLAVAAPAFVQAPVVREVAASDAGQTTVVPATPSSGVAESSGAAWPADTPGLLGDAPLAGVVPVELEFLASGGIGATFDVVNQTTFADLGGITYEEASWAVGGVDDFGPSSFFGQWSTALTQLAPGQAATTSFDATLMPSLRVTYTPASSVWGPFFVAGVPTYSVGARIRNLGASLTVSNLELRAWHESVITARFRLEPLTSGTAAFCGPAGPHAPPDLRAFGSAEAGTDWLTLRVEGVPAQSPVALVGTTLRTQTVGASQQVCIGGARVYQGVTVAGADLAASFDVDLAPFLPGDRVHFQALYRTPGSWDVSSGLSLAVR